MQLLPILLVVALMMSIVGNVILAIILTRLHQEEKKELHDRLMARDYPEYKMSKDYELELKRKEQQIEREGKESLKAEKMTKEDLHRRNMAKQF